MNKLTINQQINKIEAYIEDRREKDRLMDLNVQHQESIIFHLTMVLAVLSAKLINIKNRLSERLFNIFPSRIK